MVEKLKEKIDSLRKKIIDSFFIRGTTIGLAFKKKIFAYDKAEIPAYVVQPLYKMDSGEWLQRLDATIHAAVARSIQHARFSIDWENLEAIKEKHLPVLMVFGPRGGFYSLEAYKTLFGGEIKFDTEFRPVRERYEYGIVHGVAKPTFPETSLDFSRRFNKKKGKRLSRSTTLNCLKSNSRNENSTK